MAPALEDATARLSLMASSSGMSHSWFKIALILGVGYYVAWVFYQLFLSPLRTIPGPKLWAISDIPYAVLQISGNGHREHKALHAKYGRVVRVGPTHISFSDDKMPKELVGHRKAGRAEHSKEPGYYRNTPSASNVVAMDDSAAHTRHRKLMSNGFSAKNLQEQESIIMKYMDLLMDRLREYGKNGTQTLDVVKWYNFTTFDVIGDLVFGEPFGCLDGAAYHPWVALIFDNIREGTYLREARRVIPGVKQIVPLLESFIPNVKKNEELVVAKLKKRMDMTDGRPDLMDKILSKDANGNMVLSWEELRDNSNLFIIAGSETTATVMSGISYLLSQHPQVTKKLTDEVLNAYTSEEQITFVSTQQLKYMHAVIEESMRVYPAAPSYLPRRIASGGDTISGVWLPGGTTVSQWQSTTFTDSNLWVEPESFIPERWLGDERFADDKRASFHPFSTGPRNCIGMNLAYAEIRVMLARMIWNFELEVAPESKNWIGDMKVYTLYEKPPLHMYLKPRIHKV